MLAVVIWRKEDLRLDAAWWPKLDAHGLLWSSFVLDEPIRRLRGLTRASTAITR